MDLCSTLLLSSYLRRHQHDVQRINHIDAENEASRTAEIQAFAPQIIAVSTTFVLSGQHLSSIGRKLRAQFPSALLIAGGHHVAANLLSMEPAEKANYLKASGFDIFVEDFQGEATLLALANTFPGPLDAVPNLIWRQPNGNITQTPRRIENTDINDTRIDFTNVTEGSVVHIRTARSCSFKCAFCSYPSVAGPLALMDMEYVKQTLRKAKEAKSSAVFFVDDTFNVPSERFEALLDWMIEEDMGLPWYSFLRCQHVNKNIVAKMRDSGCAGVFLGVESGSDKILKNMKKGATSRFYREGIRWLKEADILTVGAFIIGYPGETEETVQQTQELIENYGLDFYFLQPFYYLHHTPVHKRAKEFGLSGKGLFWQHATMTSSEAMRHLHRLFTDIKQSIFVNPDYTLWEIAYLRAKGLTLNEIREYRQTINRMTLEQMERYGVGSPVAQKAKAG